MVKKNKEDILETQIERKYDDRKILPDNSTEIKKEMNKTKKELEKLKDFIIKKYPFTLSLSLLPPQAVKFFINEEEIPKETEKYVQFFMIIPEKKFKEIPKIKKEVIEEIEKLQKNLTQKIWFQLRTPIDLWEMCLDSKFELMDGISMSFPLYDKGFLGSLRITGIHKSLVVQKFDKYVVSYVISGSFLRGEATKNSDIDVFVIINDTDVKRMPRLELKERLRAMIYQYINEASALAGVKNELHIQTYLLTEFWDSVKDAHPVIFTFIRDGIPIYDKGTFMPWKALLKMGKLKPSPEAIDMFMKTAERTKEMVGRRLIDAMIDLYYGVLNPSQAMVMLYGSAPPTHKETVQKMEEIFVKKEKMLKKSDIAILEKSVKLFKKYEHDPKYKISGKEIDELIKDSEIYLKRLKELRKQIENRYNEKTIEQIYRDVFGLLKAIVKSKAQKAIIEEFEKNFVKKGIFASNNLRTLKDIVKARNDFKKGKLDAHAVNEARKNASVLINDLIEYNQRCDFVHKNNNKK
jgi:predicted nucleotidyltransferase/uncharacterized protein (UPF0332 family)